MIALRTLLYRTRSQKIFNEPQAPFSTNNNSHFDTMTSILYRNCIKFHDLKFLERKNVANRSILDYIQSANFFCFVYSPSFAGTWWWWLLLHIYLFIYALFILSPIQHSHQQLQVRLWSLAEIDWTTEV